MTVFGFEKVAAGVELFCGVDRRLSHWTCWGQRSFEFVECGSSISDFGIGWTGAVSWIDSKEITERLFAMSFLWAAFKAVHDAQIFDPWSNRCWLLQCGWVLCFGNPVCMAWDSDTHRIEHPAVSLSIVQWLQQSGRKDEKSVDIQGNWYYDAPSFFLEAVVTIFLTIKLYIIVCTEGLDVELRSQFKELLVHLWLAKLSSPANSQGSL